MLQTKQNQHKTSLGDQTTTGKLIKKNYCLRFRPKRIVSNVFQVVEQRNLIILKTNRDCFQFTPNI